MKKLLIPVAVVLLGTGGAFATKIAKDSRVEVTGYRFGNVGEAPCVVTPQRCETMNTGNLCTWTDENNISHDLKQLSGSACGVDLYEIIEP